MPSKKKEKLNSFFYNQILSKFYHKNLYISYFFIHTAPKSFTYKGDLINQKFRIRLMDPIIVIAAGIILVVTGAIDPLIKNKEDVAQAPKTEVSTPAPEPKKEPEPEPEPEPATQTEEPKEQVNAEANQEQDAKPEEEEVKPVTEETPIEEEKEGLSIVNIMLYILGAIAVIAAGIYFFMRRDPSPQSAADIARAQSQQPKPEPQPEPEQPVQEETQPENTDQSSNNDDENNNR